MTLNPKLDPTCQLYYSFEELASGQAIDSSSYARHSVTFQPTIQYSDRRKAAYFDTNKLIITPAFGMTGTVLTLNCWLKLKKRSSGLQTIISDGGQSGTVGFIWMYVGTNSYTIYFQYANGTTFDVCDVLNFFSGYENIWTMLTIVCDYENKTLNAYRNASLFGTYSLSGTPVFPSTSRAKYIGNYLPGYAHYIVDGYLDEVALWNRALSEREITELYYYTRGALTAPAKPMFVRR